MAGAPVPSIERMTLLERGVHGLTALSVLLLLLSGLALAYHHTFWGSALISAMGGPEGRHLLHRVAAAGLLLATLLHVAAYFGNRRYRDDVRGLRLRREDWVEFGRNLRYNWTRSGPPGRYGRFTPGQKVQYWGIVAGCLLMTVSGLFLWLPQATLALFPKAFFDFMLVLHSKEAQLILILLFLWHLYDVHVAGGNFPMNPSWLTGRMRLDLYRRQHPADPDLPEEEAP